MSQKVYADEATLTAHLEKLLDTATTPTHSTSLYADTTIAPNQLVGGYNLANEQLSTIGITPLPALPSPETTKGNDEILAAAFTAIIRLSQCAHANKNLREAAETSLRASTKRLEDLSKRLEFAEARVKKKEALIATMRNAETETTSKHRTQLRKVSAETSQLRSRLVHAAHRENQLVLSAKKKEKEFGQLQSRVHALFKTSASIEPRITRVGMRVSPRADESLDANVEDIGEDRIVAVEGENDVMRGLLQAVQEELDELILSHGCDAASQVSDELDVPPAPEDEVMALPMEVIGGELQDCLEKKFGILRKAFERGGRIGEYGHGSLDGGDDSVDGFDHHGDGDAEHGEEDGISAGSANRSVDLMSGKVERNDEDARPGDTEGELIDADAKQVDADPELVNAGTERIDAVVEQVDADAELVHPDAEQIDTYTELVHVDAEQIDTDAELVHADAEQIDTNAELVHADAEQMDTNAELADAETPPMDPAANAEPIAAEDHVDVCHESVDRSADAVDDTHETLEHNLRTLSLTDATGSATEPINATKD